MAPVTNQMLNAKREAACVGITTERKYFRCANAWVKRSLRPSEWQTNPFAGTLVVPRFGMERILNEAAAMQFVAEKTEIPVPKLYGCFEDDGAAYLVMEYIEGVTMNELNDDERKIVETKLEGYIETLRSLKSAVWGGPTGIVRVGFRLLPGDPLVCANKVLVGHPTLSCHGESSPPRVEDEVQARRRFSLLPQRFLYPQHHRRSSYITGEGSY